MSGGVMSKATEAGCGRSHRRAVRRRPGYTDSVKLIPLERRHWHRSITPPVIAIVVACVSGCQAAVDAYAVDPVSARTAASQVATSVQYRFDEPSRDTRFGHARMRVARYAMAPSKVEGDTIWTRQVGATRELSARGRLVNGRYVFTAQRSVPMPSSLAESRHVITLDTLADGDRLWRTEVDQAIGTVTPLAMRAVFKALLRSGERSASEIRADYRRTMPRTSSAFGRLASLDSVHTVRMADGSTIVSLGIQLNPAGLDREFPDFARFVRKYLSPSRYRYVLRDPASIGVHANDTWFVVEGRNDLITLRFRSRNGDLQPLDGPARAMSDTMTLDVDASAKFGLFTVGVRDMRARFVFVNTVDEVGWDLRFNTPPGWDLPPIAGRLVRGPLNRPFRGDGVVVRLTAKRLTNGQTVIHRRSDVAVHESALMRWLGNLGFTAMDDFSGRVELEEARFLSEAMRAMRQDISSSPARPGP